MRVFNDHGIEPGPRRSLSGDLVVVPMYVPMPLVVAEFKFEPSHRRADIDPRKLPVVGWEGVVEDVARIRRWVDGGLAKTGIAIFVDEGGFVHGHRDALTGCSWEGWGSYGELGLDVWTHRLEIGSASQSEAAP